MPRLAGVSLQLPKVSQALLIEFGHSVKHARSRRGWELNDVANRIAEMDAGKTGKTVRAPTHSFPSNIEKGKRSISPPTVGKLIHALDLPESWLNRFLTDAPDAPDEETPNDREAERLIRRAEADPDAPETPEALLLLLAEDWAGRGFTDPMLAYSALRDALRSAADLRAYEETNPNLTGLSSQLRAVLRRASKLTDEGRLDEADAVLQLAQDQNSTDSEALFHALLSQDRIQYRPEIAAERTLAHLVRYREFGSIEECIIREGRRLVLAARTSSGIYDLFLCEHLLRRYFKSTRKISLPALLLSEEAEWRRGHRTGESEVVSAAVESIRKILETAIDSGDLESATEAHLQLSLAHWGHGELSRSPQDFRQSLLHACKVRKLGFAEERKQGCSDTYNIIGVSLSHFGRATNSQKKLELAIKMHEVAASIREGMTDRIAYITSLNNIAVVKRWLGTILREPTFLDSAKDIHDMVLSELRTISAPNFLGITKWNLGAVFLERYAISGGEENLRLAHDYVCSAREDFIDGADFQRSECDRLQTEIAAARIKP